MSVCVSVCLPLSLFIVLLQNLLRSTGGQGKPTVFLITDSQIKEESFLEDIDSLLNTAEVPNLFAADEKAEILEVIELIFSAYIIFVMVLENVPA